MALYSIFRISSVRFHEGKQSITFASFVKFCWAFVLHRKANQEKKNSLNGTKIKDLLLFLFDKLKVHGKRISQL